METLIKSQLIKPLIIYQSFNQSFSDFFWDYLNFSRFKNCKILIKVEMQLNSSPSISLASRITVTLALILYLFPTVRAQYQPSSCFATYQAILWGNSSSAINPPTSPQTTGYPFSLAWGNTYPYITSSSYVLTGFKIGEDKPLSFTATLSVNPTGGTLTFIPASVSSIIYAAFSIILVSRCSGILHMQRVVHATTILYNPVRNSLEGNEYFNVVTPFSFSNFSDYAGGYFISSFLCDSMALGANQQLGLAAIFVRLNSSITFWLFSNPILANALTEVTVTYIIAEVSTFKSKLIFFANQQIESISLNIHTFTSNFGTPAIYNQKLTQKFIIGYNYMHIGSPSQIYLADSGTMTIPNITNLIQINIYKITFAVFALMECDSNNLVDSVTAPTKCRPCSDFLLYCASCSSPVVCTSCVTGWWLVKGGCTNISNCFRVVQNYSMSTSTCIACFPGFNFNLSLCSSCPSGYWIVTSHCTNILGCVSTALVGGQSVCIFCDFSKRYSLDNKTCGCVLGFYMGAASQCLEICGDGRIFSDQCDDGNTDNGDGCSSTCRNEIYFICYNGSQIHKSDCVYVRRDFSLSLKWIDKVNGQNQGIFAFTVHPPFTSLDRLNLTVNLYFQCDQQSQFVSWTYSSNLLLVNVNYQQNLQGNRGNITLIFDPTFIRQNPFSLLFSMTSNGDKLIVVRNYSTMVTLVNIMTIISFFALFLFAAGSLTHKMIGVETLHTFQIIFLLQMLNKNSTPVFGLMRSLSIVIGNFLFLINAQTDIYQAKSDIKLNAKNQNFSESIIVGVSLLFSLFFISTRICKLKQTLEASQDNSNKQSTTDILVKVVYTYLLFPFITGFLMVNLLNIVIDTQQVAIIHILPGSLNRTFSLILMIVSSFIFFFEGKLLLVRQGYKKSLQGLPRCESSYVPLYLIYLLSLTIVMVVDYHQNFDFAIEIITVIVLTLFVYLAVRRPYQSCLHNAGLITNVLTVLYFVCWMVTRQYFIEITSQESQIFYMFLLCGLMAMCLIISSIRIVAEIRIKCKPGKDDNLQSAKMQIKEVDNGLQEFEIQRQYLQRFLHNYNPFYLEVMKQQENMQELNRVNQQRLLSGAVCLYTQGDIEANLSNLSNRYRKRERRVEVDRQLFMLKSSLKDSLYNRSAKKEWSS